MKLKILFVLTFIITIGFTTGTIFAKSNEMAINTNESMDVLSDYDENEKVIPLDGGFLGGEAWLQNGNQEIYLNSETDPAAITIKEARKFSLQNDEQVVSDED